MNIKYDPSEVVAGQDMTVNYTIRNCSGERQQMRFMVQPSGPCA